MAEQHPKQDQPIEPKPASNRSFKIIKEVGIFVIIIVLGALAAWGINQFSGDDKSEDTETVAELPNYATPNTSPDDGAFTNTPSDENMEEEPAGESSETPEYGTPSAAPATGSYQNTTLGFSMALPIGWATADESTAREIVFYDTLYSGVISSVEVYDNSSGETLDSLMEQLRRSPNIVNIRKVSVAEQEWVAFDSKAGTFNRGMTTVKNGRIYYLNGELSKSEFAGDLRFL